MPAPDWALGIQGRDQNGFTLLDARDYQVQSLTAPTREARDRNTALLFRALGQVVHLLEDMAQPQHTRNDPHAGCVEFIAGGHSWYEEYTEMRALRQNFRTRAQIAPPLVLGGYAPVSLPTYRDFFAEPNPGRRGLAHVSSRNFYSAGTNLGFILLPPFRACAGLEPICGPAQYVRDQREERNFSLQMLDGTVRSGDVTLYRRSVFDPLTGQRSPTCR